MIDFASLLLAPVYAAFGAPVTFVTEDGATLTVTAIDKSSGLVVGSDPQFQTIRPAVVVRMADVLAAGLAAESLDGAAVTMSGKTWRVEAAQPRPNPGGEGAGELVCYIIEVAE